jgi:hypothetical protein
VKQAMTQAPTEHGGPGAVGINAWPIQKQTRLTPQGTGDDGMVGAHSNDRVMLHNAHPHQEHSVGYTAEDGVGTSYETHGFAGVHITHGKRDKGPEHHPPKGLMEHGAQQSSKQQVFG